MGRLASAGGLTGFVSFLFYPAFKGIRDAADPERVEHAPITIALSNVLGLQVLAGQPSLARKFSGVGDLMPADGTHV